MDILDFDLNLDQIDFPDLDLDTLAENIGSQINAPTEEIQEILVNVLKDFVITQGEKVVKYTDLIAAILSSVTTIIDTITYALIAFVAISLVVSSIMIGVITYVSVLERIKEIGILRAIGASKKDIRRVFNAEILIIGFISGVFGILVTYILSYFANIIVYDRFGIPNIASLDF